MLLKVIFTLTLHHNPIRVEVEEGCDAKRDGLTPSWVDILN
jgi:hypothetical protein